MGLFRCNRCPGWREDELRYWNLHISAARFSNMHRSFLERVGGAPRADDLIVYGRALYSEIFSNCRVNEDSCEEARKAFQEFLAANLRPPGNRVPPATLFVRFVDRSGKPFTLLPVGLMAVPLGENREEFVGYHLRVESPLDFQDYSVEEDCIANWVMLLPPEDEGDLAAARKRLQNTIGNWPREVKTTDIRAFEQWLSGKPQTSFSPQPAHDSTILMTFSHHDGDALFFRSKVKLPSGSVNRLFKAPSIAIMNGCGLFKPDHTGFVERLNWRGVTALIATATDVDALMAADFFSLLDQYLRQQSTNGSSRLADAYFDTVRRLWDTNVGEGNPNKWGPRALIYSLAGNGALRICTPM